MSKGVKKTENYPECDCGSVILSERGARVRDLKKHWLSIVLTD